MWVIMNIAAIIKKYRTQIALALVYFVLFNLSVLHFRFSYYHIGDIRSILELLRESVEIIIALFIIFFGLSYNRLLLAVCSLILFITGAIGSYALYFFKALPSKQMIRIFFENETSESLEILSIKLVLWLAFVIVVWISIIIGLRDHNRTPKYRILRIICLVIFCYNIATPQYRVLQSYFPISYLHSTYLYTIERSRDHARIDISQKFDFIDHSKDDTIGVLIIGESARYDHFGINGYHRDTTPLLSKTRNLFSFKAQSAANLTYLSVPSMLTRASHHHIEDCMTESTFLSVFTKLGFTTSWIGTQTLLKYLKTYNTETIYDEVQMTIIPGGSALYKLNAHDEVLLPYFDKLLHKDCKQFIVLHTSGSHWNYAARYPAQYKKFTPDLLNTTTKVDQPNCNYEELINSYDNSVLYTDYILSEVIKKLENKNAFILYASDHGESLGENGIFAHGTHMNAEQLTIPFIFWVSDKFVKDHAGLLEMLQSKQKDEINHDYIFHSALDCAGIDSDVIDKSLSLCEKTKRNRGANE